MNKVEAGVCFPFRVVLRLLLLGGIVLPFLGTAQGLRAQDGADSGEGGALRVFIDCRARGCDNRFIRTEIDFVNWVQDREDAQLHVIATGLGTGSGGQQITFDFIGREALEGVDDELIFSSLGTDTTDEVRQAFTSLLSVGVARYAALARVGQGLVVSRTAAEDSPTDRLVTSDEVEDPWNFWVFNTGFNASFNGEETSSFSFYSANFSASRTTTQWKLSFTGRGSFLKSTFELSDGEERVDERTDWSADSEVVFSLADHVSVGLRTEADASTRLNQDFGASLRPAFEYSYFPYEDAPRRALTASYEVGIRHFNYVERTIFGKTSETRPQHVAVLRLFQQEPWGSSSVTVTGRQFLHDFSKNSLSLRGNLNFRVSRGLSLSVGANYSLVDDQLFLSADGVSDEDILLGRIARRTDKRYGFNVGFGYRFGSIFNNVVNNRF